MSSTGGDEKAAVAQYFNGVGFERWNKIYGTTDDVNSVRACFASFSSNLNSAMAGPS